MVRTSSDAAAIAQRRKLGGKVIAFLVLVALVYLQPKVQTWLDGRNATAANSVENRDSSSSTTLGDNASAAPAVILDVDVPPVAEVDRTVQFDDAAPSDIAPSDAATQTPKSASNNSSRDGKSTSSDVAQAEVDEQPPLGKLREIRDYVFESTAGLLYVPGSADRHRLRHVMQHAKDDISKEIHGVFDGDRDEILATIDEAYQKAVKGGREVRSQTQNDRLVYTVNLARKIGYMGGAVGERKGNPECRYLRIVLEDDNVVISAYPTVSF